MSATEIRIATIAGRAAVVRNDQVHMLGPETTVRGLLADWERSLQRLREDDLGDPIPAAEVSFDPPVPDPPNLFMAGANYFDHLLEMGNPSRPRRGVDQPFLFLKSPTSLVGDGAEIHPPANTDRLDWEAELAVVIGDGGRIAAYTVLNDLSARDHFRRDNVSPPMTWDWLTQKSWATACPCGPWLVPADQVADPYDLALRLTVNGELMQDSNTGQMIFRAEDLIEFLARYLPLRPGDIVATGTCAGTGAGRQRFLQPSDEMVAEVEGIGRLRNRVFRGDPGDRGSL